MESNENDGGVKGPPTGSLEDIARSREALARIMNASKSPKETTAHDVVGDGGDNKPPLSNVSSPSFGGDRHKLFLIALVVVLGVALFSLIVSRNNEIQVSGQNNTLQEKSEIPVSSRNEDKPKINTNTSSKENTLQQSVQQSAQQPAQQFAHNFVAQPTKQIVPINCVRLTDLSAGGGYLLGRGECFLMGFTPNLIYFGAESPFTSVTGSDFIITTNDESASCDSRQSSDRCTSWIQQNQKLGGEDSQLHKPRFWMLFKAFGDIYIQTSQSIVNPCIRISDLSAGKEYLLAAGECFAIGVAPNRISIPTESRITSITGADFIITSIIDQSSSCDSREVSDRCGSWIKSQHLGVKDPIFHKPRYWNFIKAFGDIRIYTEVN